MSQVTIYMNEDAIKRAKACAAAAQLSLSAWATLNTWLTMQKYGGTFRQRRNCAPTRYPICRVRNGDVPVGHQHADIFF